MNKRIYQTLMLMILLGSFFFSVPQPLGISACGTMEDEAEFINNYIPDEIEVPALKADIASVQALENAEGAQPKNAVRKAGAGILPVSYDARTSGYVTSVKDQEDYDNTCWAFSAVSMAESGILAKGKTVGGTNPTKNTLDLSEQHLAYYFYHTPKDPLGNTDGDATKPLGDYLSVGGNHIFTTFAFAGWIGLAEESKTKDMDWANNTADISEYPNAVHLQKAYWINLSKDVSNVKKMIMEYGSVAVSMRYFGAYYNAATASYYYSVAAQSVAVNHAVAIVGWDDNYSKDNFNTSPQADGAWLVKNSYGEGFGEGGYFWISYEDTALTQSTAKAFVFEFEDAANYQYIYQYDGSAGAYMESGAGDTGCRVASGNSIANVFTVPQDVDTGYQSLEAVSFALYAVSVDYSVQIYKNPTDPAAPDSGMPLLQQPIQGTTSFVGYYTVKLDEELILAAGDSFSIVVTLSKSDGGNVSYFVDKTYTNGNWISFVNAVESGQSFAYAGGTWQDLSASGATARVKAFTNDYLIPTSGLTISEKKMTLTKGETARLSVKILPENASYQSVTWSSSDSSIVTVDKNGKIKAVAKGTATITAQAKDNSNITASCKVTVKQKKVNQQNEKEESEENSTESEVSMVETDTTQDATGYVTSPQTGDSAAIWLWAVLALLAAGAILFEIIYFIRKKKKK